MNCAFRRTTYRSFRVSQSSAITFRKICTQTVEVYEINYLANNLRMVLSHWCANGFAIAHIWLEHLLEAKSFLKSLIVDYSKYSRIHTSFHRHSCLLYRLHSGCADEAECSSEYLTSSSVNEIWPPVKARPSADLHLTFPAETIYTCTAGAPLCPHLRAICILFHLYTSCSRLVMGYNFDEYISRSLWIYNTTCS